MVSLEQANYSINISLHVFILFTFLTVFFFAFISKVSKKSIKDAFGDIINKQVGNVLTKIDDLDQKLSSKLPTINWKNVNDIAVKIEENAQGDLPEIKKNNSRLLLIGIAIIVTLFLLVCGLFAYFKLYKKYDISIWHIIGENIVIFIFIGLVEFLFFTKIATKYIPVTPDFVAISILERVKTNMGKKIRSD